MAYPTIPRQAVLLGAIAALLGAFQIGCDNPASKTGLDDSTLPKAAPILLIGVDGFE